MKTLREELKDRLFFIYRYSTKPNFDSRRLFIESCGVHDIVDEITLVFGKQITQYINLMISEKIDVSEFVMGKHSIIQNSNITKQELFFSDLNVDINIKLSDYDYNHFAYQAYNDNFNGIKLKECDIDGESVVNLNDLGNSIAVIKSLFAHEILHAYEDWKRYKGGSENIATNSEKYGYERNRQNGETLLQYKKQLSYIIYYLTPFEIRAYCAQIIKNNEDKFKKCSTSKQAFNVVKNDNIFKNYEDIEEWVNDIYNGQIRCSKNEIEWYWKQLTGFSWKYKRIRVYLKDKMEKAKREILNNIGKKINELALLNGNWVYMGHTDDLLSKR